MTILKDILAEIVRRPHPALVHFSIGSFFVGAIFALIFLFKDRFLFLQVSYWTFIVGVVFMVPIGLSGLLDYFRLKEHSAKAHRLLMAHLINGVIATVISVGCGLYFGVNSPIKDSTFVSGYIASVIVLALLVLIQGAIAALMVYQHKLGVDDITR